MGLTLDSFGTAVPQHGGSILNNLGEGVNLEPWKHAFSRSRIETQSWRAGVVMRAVAGPPKEQGLEDTYHVHLLIHLMLPCSVA